MSGDRVDVAVVGGGPAGLSAAITLALQGQRVVVFEARHYPHDKMCGEFLSPECAGLLDRLGLPGDHLRELGAVPIDRARLTAPSGTAWEERLPGAGFGISRKAFDHALAQRARQVGVTICEGATVTGVQGDLTNGFTLETRAGGQAERRAARVVIAAHGKRSSFDRVLNRAFLSKQHPFVALKAHFHGPAIPGRVELNGFPGGYCGISEIEGDARVACLLVAQPVFQQFGQGSTDAFIEWMVKQNPRLRAWFSQAERIHPRWITIAQVAFDPKPAVEGDILMAGDAAGLIAPLAGNGISMALEGGLMVGKYTAAFLTGQIERDELTRAYPAAWNRRFGRRLRLGRWLQPMMMHPSSLSLVLKLLKLLPAAGKVLVEKTRS